MEKIIIPVSTKDEFKALYFNQREDLVGKIVMIDDEDIFMVVGDSEYRMLDTKNFRGLLESIKESENFLKKQKKEIGELSELLFEKNNQLQGIRRDLKTIRSRVINKDVRLSIRYKITKLALYLTKAFSRKETDEIIDQAVEDTIELIKTFGEYKSKVPFVSVDLGKETLDCSKIRESNKNL